VIEWRAPDADETVMEVVARGTDEQVATAEVVSWERRAPERLAPGRDVLHWWHDHQASSPHIYQLAVALLVVPATNTSSERTFSMTGDILTKKRNRLRGSSRRSRVAREDV